MDEYINNEITQQFIEWGADIGGYTWDLLLSMIPWSILFSFLGLVASLIICLVIYKTKWLKREHIQWNVATKFFYLAIFLGCILTGCATGGIYGIQRDIDHRINEDLVPRLEKELPTLHEYIMSYAENLEGEGNSDDIVKSILHTLYFKPSSDGFFARAQAKCINWVTLNFGKWLITAGVGAILGWIIGRTGEDFGLTGETITFTLDIIKQMDLSEVDSSIVRIVVDVFQQKTDQFFTVIYTKVFLILGLVFLVIIAESLYYHLWYLKRVRVGPK